MGDSLLTLAKSIYYELPVLRRKHSLACMMQFFNKSSIGENVTAPLVKLDHVGKSVAQKCTNPLRHDIFIAVQLATEKLFQQSCKTLDVDIIYLDMTERLPFYSKCSHWTRNTFWVWGLQFVCNKRLVPTALDLGVFAKGKNIIILSGAVNELDFRGPYYDISNLGLLFNLKEEQSKAVITKNCKDVLFHANARKGTGRSVISGKLLKKPAQLLSDSEEGDISEGCTGHSKEHNFDDNDKDDKYKPKEKKSKVEWLVYFIHCLTLTLHNDMLFVYCKAVLIVVLGIS